MLYALLSTLALALVGVHETAAQCSNYGIVLDSSCLCPAGFSSPASTNCSFPTCGGSLYQPGTSSISYPDAGGNVSACACAEGWSGPSCTVCRSAIGCSAELSKYLNSSTAFSTSTLNTTLTCSTVPTVFAASQMSCSVIQPTLQALFPLSSTLTITRFLNASLTPGGQDVLSEAGIAAGDGLVWAQLWYDDVEQFFCRASDCVQTIKSSSTGANSSEWVCPNLNCSCRPGTDFCGGGQLSASQNLTGAINVLAGPLTIDCSSDGSCAFKQSFLNALFGSNGLELTSCFYGECVEQFVVDQASGLSEGVSSGSGISGGVIAGLAVVGAIVVAIIAVAIYCFRVRSKVRHTTIVDSVTEFGGVGLVWSGIGYKTKPANGSHWRRLIPRLRRLNPFGGHPSAQPELGLGVGTKGGKIILKDLCGELPVGGFCCILGPSGAGKTTMIDILAGRHKSGYIEGKVAFVKRTHEGRRVKVGYVDQSDILSPTSTVFETLLFAARLRLPECIPESVKEARAHAVLSQLGLNDVAHTRIGSSAHRGISGGEMRRVSIGIELVGAPDVLFLDEPTSGLDSVSAARLINLLKLLCEDMEHKTTIVASIHQPNSALYHAFSQVVLLANGRQLYFGPGGNKPAEYFETQGRPCPSGYNIADHLLDIASGINDDPVSDLSLISPTHEVFELDIQDNLAQSQLEQGGRRLTTTSSTEKVYPHAPTTSPRHDDLSLLNNLTNRTKWWPSTHCATTFLTQIEVLSGREWRNLKRDKTLLMAHICLACVVGLFAGGLYFKVNLTIAGFQNRVGSLFFLGSLIAFSSLSALYNLVEVKSLFLRERSGSYYSPQAWLVSRLVFDVIPLRLIPTILVGIIVYFMVGLSHQPARFFKYILILVEYSLGMAFFNFLLACLFSHGGVAILCSSLFNLFLMTYAGFFVNISQIPPVLQWLRWFSTLAYALEALAVNEVGSGLQIIDTLNGVPIEISAELIMETLFGFELDNYYRDVLVLFAFICGFGVLLVGVVVFSLRESR